jgi:sterol desaturase/sphingolipid hydroxylase (fatty acid hydroxylase superfamily)
MLQDIAVKLIEPAFHLFLPQHRFFWLHLCAAIAIALVVCYVRQPHDQGRSIANALRAVFPRQIFLHRSAVLDYRYVVINHVLHAVVLGALIANTVAMTHGVLAFLRYVSGEDGLNAAPGPVASIVFTKCVVLAIDGGLFLAHWLQHKIPTLWEFHKVHHSAGVLTPITVLRMHPVDIILNALTQTVLLGVANAVFLYLYSGPVSEVTVIGANAITFLFYAAGYHLRHSHVWILFPRGIREHISSPALHHIHHSKHPKHFDKNFARFFTFWDRLAGTLYIPEDKEELEFGLGEKDQRELSTVWQLYATPFRNAFARLRRRAARFQRRYQGNAPAR